MVSEVQAGVGVVGALVVGFFAGVRYQHRSPTPLHAPPQLGFPRFVSCYCYNEYAFEQRLHCGDFVEAPRVDCNEFAGNVARQAMGKAVAGVKPLLLSIGSRDFYPDFFAYPPVLSNSSSNPYRLVLVEPDDHWDFHRAFSRWKELFPDQYIPMERAHILRGAVSANCPAHTTTFHRVSQALADLVEAKDPEKAAFMRQHFGANSLSRQWLENDLLETFASYGIANLTAYIEEVSVPCFGPPQLLESIGALPSDLVMLTVDAEGEDRGFVNGLLRIGARPAYIVFETNIQYGSNMWVVPALRKYGYVVGIHCHERCKSQWSSANIVAVHQDFYSGP